MSDVRFRPFAWSDVPAITAIYRPYVTDSVITFEYDPPGEAEMAGREEVCEELAEVPGPPSRTGPLGGAAGPGGAETGGVFRGPGASRLFAG